MKKLVMMMTVVGLLVTSLMSVSAAEVEFESNMNGETYRTAREAQVKAALEAKTITEEQANLLLEHIAEVADSGAYGNGPTNGAKGEGNAECVLGDNELGIFRSESAGMRTGSGNGVGEKSMDGSGSGNGYKGGNGAGKGAGNGTRGAGQGNLEDCVLEPEL